MGNNNSTPESPSLRVRPDGLQQLNSSVWELYKPEGVPRKEVIFFHGLQLSDYKEAFWKTWQSRDNSVVWPKEWLGPALQNARISAVSYDSSARRTDCTGVLEMYNIIENLFQDVVLSSSFNIDPDSKVILVGHSMGGLIIKQLLLKCLERHALLSDDPQDSIQKLRIETFLRNCKGIFYYSTPHGGTELAAYADRASHIPGANINMPIIKFLKVLSNETARINNDFSRVRNRKLNIATQAIGEVLVTKFKGLSAIVVPEASARQDVDLFYSAITANHFDVCKAENNTSSNIFLCLEQFCGDFTKDDSEALGLPDVPTHTPLPTASSSRSRYSTPLPANSRT